MAEMGNASVSNVAVNAADTLLAIFSALRESNMSNTVAQALAIAMPFANDPLDRKDQLAEARRHSDATLRLYILVRTLRELRETALSNRAVERTVATRALDEAASFLSAAPRQLDGSGSWLAGTISERMLDAFRVMSHALPKDRHQVPANARQELVVALAGLRAVAAEPGTDAALRAAIQRIIATLEEAIIASYAEGQSSLVDIMVRWKRQHDGFEATFDALPVKDDGAVAVRRAYADVAKAVVNCMRGIADDVLRVAGIVQIASTLNNSIPTNF